MKDKRLMLLGAAFLCSSHVAVASEEFQDVREDLSSPVQATDSQVVVGVDRSEFSSLLGAVNPNYSDNFDPSQLDANDRAIASELVSLKAYMGTQDDAWLDAAVRDAASDNVESKGRVERYVGDVFGALPSALKSKISNNRQMYQREDASRLGVYFNVPGDDVLGVSPEITKMTAEVERLIAYQSPVVVPPPPAIECRYDDNNFALWSHKLEVGNNADNYINAVWDNRIILVKTGNEAGLHGFSFDKDGYRYYPGGKKKETTIIGGGGGGPVDMRDTVINEEFEICRESSAP